MLIKNLSLNVRKVGQRDDGIYGSQGHSSERSTSYKSWLFTRQKYLGQDKRLCGPKPLRLANQSKRQKTINFPVVLRSLQHSRRSCSGS